MLKFCACLLALAATGQTPPSESTTGDAVIEKCQVASLENIAVPGADPGALVSLSVRDGEKVTKGTELARVDDREAQAQLIVKQLEYEVAEQEANSDIEIRYSTEGANVAKAGYDKLVAANKGTKGTVTEIEILKALYEWQKAKLQIEKAREKMIADKLKAKGKKAEADAAQVSANRRVLIAPFDGVVSKVHRRIGEWVAPGEPVVQLVRVDRLRISGNLDAKKWSSQQIEGRNVTVEVRLPMARTIKVPGRVVYVSPVVGLGQVLPIYAEIDSPQENGRPVVKAGAEAMMTIHVNQPVQPEKTLAADTSSTGPALDSKSPQRNTARTGTSTGSGKAVSRTSNKPELSADSDAKPAAKTPSSAAKSTDKSATATKIAPSAKSADTKSTDTKSAAKSAEKSAPKN